MSYTCLACGQGMHRSGQEQHCYACLRQENNFLMDCLKELYRQEYPADMQFFEKDFERYLKRELTIRKAKLV